jgi:hypothetical protein
MILVLPGAPALGCSICRCGDPTFNALGLTGVSLEGVRLALDWDSVEKTQGSAEGGELESAKEQRMTLLLGYNISPDWGVYARLPRSQRDLLEVEDGEEARTHTTGFGDPEIYAQRRLWSSPFEGDVGVRASLFAVAGVKTSWGDNDLSRDGERLDEHTQPGTGSTDWFGGLSGSYQLSRRSALFASVQYRATGANDAGYEYGDVTLANVALEHKLAAHWDGVIETNYRHAGRDRPGFGEAPDQNTGGSVLYLTPRLLVNLGPAWVLRAAVQIPVATHLNGAQDEDPVYNLGVTYLLKRSGSAR